MAARHPNGECKFFKDFMKSIIKAEIQVLEEKRDELE
tara:strand:- start:51 stop:161 length:111 start_codon:yes stop_codon:yes gene_type:complete